MIFQSFLKPILVAPLVVDVVTARLFLHPEFDINLDFGPNVNGCFAIADQQLLTKTISALIDDSIATKLSKHFQISIRIEAHESLLKISVLNNGSRFISDSEAASAIRGWGGEMNIFNLSNGSSMAFISLKLDLLNERKLILVN